MISEYVLIDGTKSSLVNHIGDGSIITRFEKTTSPIKNTDVVCPHFLELKWAYGCPFDCAWCYLKGTFRFLPSKTKPVFKDYNKIETHLKRFFEETEEPEILNTGELADSLMSEGLARPFSDLIIPMFENQNKHKILFVTKSDNINNLLKYNSPRHIIISYSLNAPIVSARWENKAPPVDKRIEAARKLSLNGYEVRVRIDPIVPVDQWEIHYKNLIEQIFASFIPSRITIGSLRGLQTTINNARDKSWVEYLSEKSNWGKKIDFDTRLVLYQTIIQFLKQEFNYTNVALCKETLQTWHALGMEYRSIKCNCIF